MEFGLQLFTLAVVVLLACISPGPDFIAVTSAALANRAAGLRVALGVSIACAVWAALAMFGLGFVLTQISWGYEAIRIVGALYLIYLGSRMLYAARRPYAEMLSVNASPALGSSFRRGLLVGLTNPKSAAFFGSLFVTVLPAHAPLWVETTTLAIVLLVAVGWFCALALMFSATRVRSVYASIRRPIDALMGAVLVGLGVRLAVAR